MSSEAISAAERKMARAIEAMQRDFQGIRTGRASTALVERIHVVERTIVRRMRFHERNHQNKRIALMFLDEVARVFLKKPWPRQLDRQIADGYFRESSVRFVWRKAL